MVKLTIKNMTAGGPVIERTLADGVFTAGRNEGCDIVLSSPTVSGKHVRMRIHRGTVSITDVGSTNRTYINTTCIPIDQETAVPLGQPVVVGLFELTFVDSEAILKTGPSAKPSLVSSMDEAIDSFKSEVLKRLIDKLDLVRLEAQNISKADLRSKASSTITELVNDMVSKLPGGKTREEIIKEILDESLGLGPLEELLADKSVTEIMVVSRNRIYVERAGKIVLSRSRFSSVDHLKHAIERIVSSKGRRIDELHPYVDTRLDDGSRVNAIIPPIAIDSPVLTIRKFPDRRFDVDDLIRFGSMTQTMSAFLHTCIKYRKSTVISGGTGSGKTTLLNVLASFIPEDERLVTVEDSAELNLPQEHVIRLEARPPNIEGRGQVSIRDLVKNCLRMRPDRIVIGECRGGEAIDMLQAMNTGHDGSLTTLHANTPDDAISRLVTMCLMSDLELPSRSILEQIGSAVSLIVQATRLVDGSRKIVKICEITGMDEHGVVLDTIFEFKETGYDPKGKVLGNFICRNPDPLVFRELREQKIEVPDLSIRALNGQKVDGLTLP